MCPPAERLASTSAKLVTLPTSCSVPRAVFVGLVMRRIIAPRPAARFTNVLHYCMLVAWVWVVPSYPSIVIAGADQNQQDGDGLDLLALGALYISARWLQLYFPARLPSGFVFSLLLGPCFNSLVLVPVVDIGADRLYHLPRFDLISGSILTFAAFSAGLSGMLLVSSCVLARQVRLSLLHKASFHRFERSARPPPGIELLFFRSIPASPLPLLCVLLDAVRSFSLRASS